MRRFRNGAIASLAVLATVGTAFAADPGSISNRSSYTVEIRGWVPVICQATFQATNVQRVSNTGPINVGGVSVFCNDPRGFQLFVDHAPGVRNGFVIVDRVGQPQQRLPMGLNGSTLIASSETAARGIYNVSLDLEDASRISTMSLRMVPNSEMRGNNPNGSPSFGGVKPTHNPGKPRYGTDSGFSLCVDPAALFTGRGCQSLVQVLKADGDDGLNVALRLVREGMVVLDREPMVSRVRAEVETAVDTAIATAGLVWDVVRDLVLSSSREETRERS